MDIVLIGMFTTALWWYIHDSSLKQFQQSLLHALATHVASDRGVVRLARNLVYLIDKDDTALGSLHVEVGHLQFSA